MVIDRPNFYFKADRVKRWLAIIILISFVLSFIIANFNFQVATILFIMTVLSGIIYVSLWFIS